MRTNFSLRKLADAAPQELLIRGRAEVHDATRLYYHGSGGFMIRARAAVVSVGSALLLFLLAAPAAADATLFLGSNTTPEWRKTQGFSVGAGLLLLGFEFEYANTSDDLETVAPTL